MTKDISRSIAGNTYFTVDTSDTVLVLDALGRIRNKTPIITRSAINDTARELKQFLVKNVSKKYVAKQAEIKGSMKETKATTSRLEAKLVSASTMTEMYDRKITDKSLHWPFVEGETAEDRPRILKGKVIKASKLAELALKPGARDAYKAFVAELKAGSKSHIAVVQRIPGSHMKGKPWKEAIKKLLAPADPMMVGKVYDENDVNVSDILSRHIEQNMDKYFK